MPLARTRPHSGPAARVLQRLCFKVGCKEAGHRQPRMHPRLDVHVSRRGGRGKLFRRVWNMLHLQVGRENTGESLRRPTMRPAFPPVVFGRVDTGVAGNTAKLRHVVWRMSVLFDSAARQVEVVGKWKTTTNHVITI